ncbi:hypothetical protein Hanom_Chr04g00339271 [Helianthus anomalus]
MQLLYAHAYNKGHRLFKEVVKMPVIKYMTSRMIDDMEEHIYNNGSLSDVEYYNEDQEDDHTWE